MANAVRIAITGSSTDAQNAIRDANKAAKEASADGLSKLKGALISLAPAAIPIAASLAPLAAHMGAGAVAAAAFGAALLPQVTALKDVSSAQDKYNTAVKQYGPNSAQAAKAQDAMVASIKSLPPETQKAAAAFLNLKGTYKGWSDELSKATVPVFTKSLEVANALLPKTSGLVLGASTQFDRLITMLGGAVATPGFDAVGKKFTAFAVGSLKSLVDGVVRLSRALSEGKADGPASKFMDYVAKTGPQVKDTLKNLAESLLHIGEAAANAGPGMLTIVNALAKLVSAIPAPVLTRMLQLYTAARLIGTTSAGVMALSRALEASAARAVLAGRAYVAAAGGASTMGAAFGTLSSSAKLTAVVAGILALAYVAKKWNDSGRDASETSRQFSQSLADLSRGASSTAVSGSIKDLNKAVDNLHQSFKEELFSSSSTWDVLFGQSKAESSASKTIDNLDKALASLVQSGHADIAAADLEKLKAAGVDIPTKSLNDYTNAQKDAAFETQITAQSLGVFGAQSVAVQKKLDAQKQSAQGLQQAIFDLNDAYRAGLDTMSSYQQAVDDATAALKGHSNALHYTNGELDLTAQAARDVYDPMSKVASAAEAAAAAAVTQTGSQEKANKILIDAHTQLVKMGTQAGLTTKEAIKLADGLDNIKDPKIKITATAAQLNSTISAANKKIAAMPKNHTTAVKGDIAQLQSVVREAQNTLKSLHDKTVSIKTTYTTSGTVAHEGGNYGKAVGGPVGAAATGGPRNNLTWVGEGGPELVDLAPGSSVRPHANSMMAGQDQGGGGAPIYLTVMLGAEELGTAMIDPLRQVIHNRGGNVQFVLGQKGR